MVYERKQGGYRRTRVREADYMRIEDASIHDALSPFEMEVKNKIAGGESSGFFLDVEDRRQIGRKRYFIRKRLKKLLLEGVLTSRQKEFFILFYEKKLSDTEIAVRMKVSRVRVRKLRWALKKALIKAAEKNKQKVILAQRAKYVSLTKKQRLIWNLHHARGLSVSQISVSLGRTQQSVYWILTMIQKKLQRENFE